MSSMNVFRITGDVLHAVSRGILIKKLHTSQSCAGISLKTQLIYAFVFSTRYLDIFWNFSSIYNWIFKIYYLVTTFYTIYLIAFRLRDSYHAPLDKTPVLYVIVPSYVAGILFARPWTIFEIFWTGSLVLEAFAMIPQFFMLYLSRNVENFTADYVATLGGYRFFYLLNWVYRSVKGVRMGWINWVTGIIQIVLYAEFFYYWLKSKLTHKSLTLPS